MRLLLGTCITFVSQLRISHLFTEGKTKEETFLMQKLSDFVAPVVIFQTSSTVFQNKGAKMNSSGVGLHRFLRVLPIFFVLLYHETNLGSKST
jgi:hypothetical protein